MSIELEDDYRPSDDEPFMNDRQREYFRRKLLQWKEDILRESKETLQNLQNENTNLPDIADRASSETDRAIELRARDRQRKLISKIEAAIKDAEEAHRGNDLEAIKAKSEALGAAAQKLGEKMYAKQQAEAGTAGGAEAPGAEAGATGGKKDDGDVVDAQGNVVMTLADMQKGMVDKFGKPVKRAIDRVKDMAATVAKLPMTAMKKAKDLLVGAGRGARNALSRMGNWWKDSAGIGVAAPTGPCGG